MLKEGDKQNFETLCEAIRKDRVCLLQGTDKRTGKYVAVICAINRDENGINELVPFAKMFSGNPYEEVDPPDPDRGDTLCDRCGEREATKHYASQGGFITEGDAERVQLCDECDEKDRQELPF